ncbi:MAG: beta-galactosidase [Planctomycetota bacterium]
MSATDLTLGRIPYGTVYLIDPELSPDEQRRDLENIKRLRFNTVVLWPAVSRWDADEPGGVAFDAVDRVMDLCAELGLKAILELQGQNTSWQEAPEAAGLPLDADGDSPRDIRINHPDYLAATLEYMRAVAEHFRGHPALLAYDIFNEIGNQSFDDATIAEFIKFLATEYDHDIRALNAAWGSFFRDFDGIAGIKPRWSRWRWSSLVASRDWHRFRGRNFTDRMDDWTAAIREADPDVTVFGDILGCDPMHNRASGYFGVHDREVAEHAEVLGLSCYGNMIGKRWWEVDAHRWAQWWRAARSAALPGQQVMISEMMTQNRTMFPWEASSMTDQVELWSYQAIFHGIQGLIYWKYRPFRRGLQVGGRGLTDFAATPNHFGEQASRVASFVEKHADTLADLHPDTGGVAILYDVNVEQLYEAVQSRWPDFYTDAHGGIFRGFWSFGVSPTYLRPADLADGVPAGIKVLAVPCNVSISQATADALLAFVRRGGHLMTESRFGLLDEDGRLWTHVPGGGLAEALGVEEVNFTARFTDTLPSGSNAIAFTDDFFQQLRLADDVEVVLETIGGEPALVARRIGKGLYVHVPFGLGARLHHQPGDALEVFEAVFGRVSQAIAPVLEVVATGEAMDVSVLLDAADKPVLVGIVNYASRDDTAVLAWPSAPLAVEGADGARADIADGRLEVTVPARRATAVFL